MGNDQIASIELVRDPAQEVERLHMVRFRGQNLAECGGGLGDSADMQMGNALGQNRGNVHGSISSERRRTVCRR